LHAVAEPTPIESVVIPPEKNTLSESNMEPAKAASPHGHASLQHPQPLVVVAPSSSAPHSWPPAPVPPSPSPSPSPSPATSAPVDKNPLRMPLQ
jgi:hypothetical protein